VIPRIPDAPAWATSLETAIRELTTEVRHLRLVDASTLTYAQACQRLGCGATKLKELIRTGRLKRSQTVGRTRMVTAESVEKILGRPARPPPKDPKVLAAEIAKLTPR